MGPGAEGKGGGTKESAIRDAKSRRWRVGGGESTGRAERDKSES